MKRLLYLMLFCIPVFVNGQKLPLDSAVYDTWQNISQTLISDDGGYVAFTVSPQQADSWLYIYNTATGIKDSVARGSKPVFSAGSKYLACLVNPSYIET